MKQPLQQVEGINTDAIETHTDDKSLFTSANTIWGAKILNPLVCLANLYKIPIFQNSLNLVSSSINIIAHSYGSNSYLVYTSFTLIAGRTFDVATKEVYEKSLWLMAKQITSHMLFFQTPQTDTYVSKDTLNVLKILYMAYDTYKNIELNYEYNYGSKYLYYQKESYVLWSQYTNAVGYYTKELGNNLDNLMRGVGYYTKELGNNLDNLMRDVGYYTKERGNNLDNLMRGTASYFTDEGGKVDESINNFERNELYKGFVECKDEWTKKDFTLKESEIACANIIKDPKFKACMILHYKHYPEFSYRTCKNSKAFQDCMLKYYPRFGDDAFKLCKKSSTEIENYITKIEERDRCLAGEIHEGNTGNMFKKCPELIGI